MSNLWNTWKALQPWFLPVTHHINGMSEITHLWFCQSVSVSTTITITVSQLEIVRIIMVAFGKCLHHSNHYLTITAHFCCCCPFLQKSDAESEPKFDAESRPKYDEESRLKYDAESRPKHVAKYRSKYEKIRFHLIWTLPPCFCCHFLYFAIASEKVTF